MVHSKIIGMRSMSLQSYPKNTILTSEAEQISQRYSLFALIYQKIELHEKTEDFFQHFKQTETYSKHSQLAVCLIIIV